MPPFLFAAGGRGRPAVPPGLGLVYPSSGVIVADPIPSLSGLSSTWQFTSSILGLRSIGYSSEASGAAYVYPSTFGTYAANGLIGFDGVAQDCSNDNHLSLQSDPDWGQVIRNAKHPEWNLCFSSTLAGNDYRAYIPYVEFTFQDAASPTVRDIWVRYVTRQSGTGGVYNHVGTRGVSSVDQKHFTWHSGSSGGALGANDRVVHTQQVTGPYAAYLVSGGLFGAGVSAYGAGTYGAGGSTTWTRQSDTTTDQFDYVTSLGNLGGGFDTAQSTWANNAYGAPFWEEYIYRFARDATGTSVVRARYRRRLTGTRILNGVTVSGPGAFGYVDATTAAAGYIWAKDTALKTGTAALPYKIGLNENSNKSVDNACWNEYAALTIVDGVTNPNPFQLDANIL